MWFSFETSDHCIIVTAIAFQDLIYTEFDGLSFKRNRPKTADGISGKHFNPSILGSTAGEISVVHIEKCATFVIVKLRNFGRFINNLNLFLDKLWA